MLTLIYSTATLIAALFAAIGLWLPTVVFLVVAITVLGYCLHDQHVAPKLRHHKV